MGGNTKSTSEQKWTENVQDSRRRTEWNRTSQFHGVKRPAFRSTFIAPPNLLARPWWRSRQLQRLATGWTVRRSNSGGGEFSAPFQGPPSLPHEGY
jgi:hypothetical protein